MGCSVLTRPFMISGAPVWSDTLVTGKPALSSTLKVPPVDNKVWPESTRARANTGKSVLSDTESNANFVVKKTSLTDHATGARFNAGFRSRPSQDPRALPTA